MRKHQLSLDEKIPGTELVVLEFLPSDKGGNQMIKVRCEADVNGRPCGTVKAMRVTAITMHPYVDKNGKLRLPHRSCGCQSRRAHREYWELRARKIPGRIKMEICQQNASGKSFQVLSKDFKLPLGVVTTVIRLYGATGGG